MKNNLKKEYITYIIYDHIDVYLKLTQHGN